MIPVSDFYRTCHIKHCIQCGHQIEEQHESYLYECERCMNEKEE